MEKKKHRFNLFDVIVILVIVVLAAAVYIISHREQTLAETVMATYTVEIADVPSGASDCIEIGAAVTDNIKNYSCGTVVGVEELPYQVAVDNTVTGNRDYAVVSGRSFVLITIEVPVLESDTGLETPEGYDVRMAASTSITAGDFYGAGYIIRVER